MVCDWAMEATTSPAGSSAGSAPLTTGSVTGKPVAMGSAIPESWSRWVFSEGGNSSGCGLGRLYITLDVPEAWAAGCKAGGRYAGWGWPAADRLSHGGARTDDVAVSPKSPPPTTILPQLLHTRKGANPNRGARS